MTPLDVTLAGVAATDFDELAALRIAAMRTSLEQVGRFDPERARERLRKSFHPEHTRFILLDGQRVGFYTFRPADDGFHLDHFYIHPEWQSRGTGSTVMRRLLAEADALMMPIRLGALRDSPSNAFYQRHGFTKVAEDEWDIYYIRRMSTPVGTSEVLIGGPEKRAIVVVDYDPRWPAIYQRHAEIIAHALGEKALAIEHVGSTSVPGLAAKPIVDIDVIVKDSADEPAYLPAFLQAGYVLRVREPDWHQHRMFRTPELDVHVHVFSPGCLEFIRHRAFRDHLRTCEEDRHLYASVKRHLAQEDWPDMNAYARAKTGVVEQILARAIPSSST